MRFLFLAFLARRAAHGYELKRLYDDRFGGVWGPVNIGQVYATMGRLEHDGLVTVAIDRSAARERKVYELTRHGRKELEGWLFGDLDGPATWKSEVVLRLAAAELAHAATSEVIGEHRRRTLQAMRDLEAAEPAGDRIGGLLVEGALLHFEAELRWLERCEQLLGPDQGDER
jgi:DNA-binding PadR family transcriptional regulator